MGLPVSLAKSLQLLPLFEGLDDHAVHGLAAHCDLITLATGQELFMQGEAAADLFVLLQGQLAVSCRAPDGVDVEVGLLFPGAVVGEMGVLDTAPRSATVTATVRSSVLGISGEVFTRMVDGGHPAVGSILAAMRMDVARRLRVIDERVDALFDVSDATTAPPAPTLHGRVHGLWSDLVGDE